MSDRFKLVNTDTGEEAPYLEEVTWTFPPMAEPSEWDRTLSQLETVYAAMPGLAARRNACTAIQLVTRWLTWLWGVE